MPATSVIELASVACLGKKQFERLFNELVGANPKEYARIVRFQKSLKLLQHCSEDTNQAQLAYQCANLIPICLTTLHNVSFILSVV